MDSLEMVICQGGNVRTKKTTKDQNLEEQYGEWMRKEYPKEK